MPLTREVKIIKVPLSDNERLPDYKPSFPRMPRLYLELLENKAKIKQDLINKEYVPQEGGHVDPPKEEKKEQVTVNKKYSEDTEVHEIAKDTESDSVSVSSSTDKESNGKKSGDTRSESSDDKPEQSDRHDKPDRSVSVSISENEHEHSNLEQPKRSESENSEHNGHKHDSPNISSSESDSDSDFSSLRSKDTDDHDDLADRLKEILGDTSKKASASLPSKYAKYSPREPQPGTKYTPYNKYKDMKEGYNHAPAPTLAELEAKGQYRGKPELRDISHIPLNEQEIDDKKRELIFKFDVLRTSYPLAAASIPEYTVHSDLREMQKAYDATVRRLSLDSTVESYKTYLIGGFMIVEYVFGSILGFEMQGFAQQQMVSMHSYHKLLIELGEKSYVPEGSKWPVELRLLFAIILNAAVFIVGKMIMKRTGANLINMMNNMHTSQPTQAPAPAKAKRRMKGPNINIDEIPDAADVPVAN